jgi:hypothetical protein
VDGGGGGGAGGAAGRWLLVLRLLQVREGGCRVWVDKLHLHAAVGTLTMRQY